MKGQIIRMGQEVIPTVLEGTELPREGKPVLCLDCGGWPIPGGAIFIPVVTCKDGFTTVADVDHAKRQRFTPYSTVGFICELCFVWRLERRARIVADTSGPFYSFKSARTILREKADELSAKKVGRK